MMHDALMFLFPGAKWGDWLLQDDGDGPYIKEWRRAEPLPTAGEIETALVAAVKVVRWQEIKSERDRRKAGGVKVDVENGDKWFHSDDSSRIQQLGLVMFGVAVPPVQWKTMDGSFVSMTQELANQIFQAVASADQAIFAKAEDHRIAMEASADPASYDFSTGWPLIYGE